MTLPNPSLQTIPGSPMTTTPFRITKSLGKHKKVRIKYWLRHPVVISVFVTNFLCLLLWSSFLIPEYQDLCERQPGYKLCQLPLLRPASLSAPKLSPENEASKQAVPTFPAPSKFTSSALIAEPEISTVATPTPASIVPAPSLTPVNTALQIGSCKEKSEAIVIAQEIRKQGFEPRIVSATVGDKGRWYRVQVGKFGAPELAQQKGEELLAHKIINAFVLAEFQPNE